MMWVCWFYNRLKSETFLLLEKFSSRLDNMLGLFERLRFNFIGERLFRGDVSNLKAAFIGESTLLYPYWCLKNDLWLLYVGVEPLKVFEC